MNRFVCWAAIAAVLITMTEGRAMELTDQDRARIALIQKMAEAAGKTLDDPSDPDKVQAVESLFAVAAMRSYAMSQVFGAQADACRSTPHASALNQALTQYTEALRDEIDLGKIYYAQGFRMSIKGKHIAESGEALTRGLEQKIQEVRQKMNIMTPEALDRECAELAKGVQMAAELFKR